ncbi:UNVERIFIED_CONTAM: hypothetical protein HDU68_009814, partial [Siphonaria sp. JEL0065]
MKLPLARPKRLRVVLLTIVVFFAVLNTRRLFDNGSGGGAGNTLTPNPKDKPKTCTTTGAPNVTLEKILAQYQTLFGHEPAPGFSRWHTFAQTKGCFQDLKLYKQIYTDLKPWRDRGGIDPRTLDPFEAEFPMRWFTKNNSFGGGADWFNQSQVLEPISFLFASNKNDQDDAGAKDFTFVMNMADESRLVPADRGSSNNVYKLDPLTKTFALDKPAIPLYYYTMDDVFTHSKCFRDLYDSDASRLPSGKTPRQIHGFFLHPETFIAQNYDAPLMSQAKML